ncbi:spermatogenesis-associated protein 7 homolog [Aulostomus maculatus]
MESRIGSTSSRAGSSLDLRGSTQKSSPFCPRSSSKLTQSIIRDHMVSHYKKVFSAKAAIDTSVPKSLIRSVKYNDQIRKEQLRKGGRPQSAYSLSQRNSRASCSSAQSTSSVRNDDSPYFCSRSSTVSSPRFCTSFHAKEIVYPSYGTGSQNRSRHRRHSASELKYQSPEAASQSACSLANSGTPSCYRTFQDPVQKTYSGDLLQKHSQHFTHYKPFTPKTLKSDKSSYLSKYRYYRSPRRSAAQDRTNSRLKQQELHHTSTKNKEYEEDFCEVSQESYPERRWSDDKFNGTYFSKQTQTNKCRDADFFDFSSRISPEGGKSSRVKHRSAEEEELMYLEFISDVTEEILSKEFITDRTVDRVIKRHIDMNRHRLNEAKMRHLLDVLRKDFEEPTTASSSSWTEVDKKENYWLDTLLPQPEPGSSKQRSSSQVKTNEEDENQDQGTGSPLSNNSQTYEEDPHPADGRTIKDTINQNHEHTTCSGDEGFHQDQAEVAEEEHSKELEDLGRSFSESLRVTSNKYYDKMGTEDEQHTSDDEF